jgi:hypothetical protein
MAFGLRAVGLAAVVAIAPAAAQAVTWNIDFGSVATTFEAPDGGGLVSGLVVTLAGVTFDTPDPDGDAPVFDPTTNDFSGEGGGIFSYYSGAAGCPEAVCLLEFENRVDPFTPPVWAAFPLVMGIPGDVLANGFYEISPIPLPAPLMLMAAAVGMLAGLGRRRR